MTYTGSPAPAGGGGTDTIGLSGITFGNTSVGNADETTNSVLFTAIIPTNKLSANGQIIRFKTTGNFVNNFSADEEAIITLNGSPILTFTTALRNSSTGGPFHIDGTIMRSGASFQQITAIGRIIDDTASDYSDSQYTALPLASTGSLVLQMTGGGFNADSVNHIAHKVWWNQA